MDVNIIIAIVVTILFINMKWVVITLIFPFQIADAYRSKAKISTGKRVCWLYMLSAPYLILERYFMRGGWQRYMLFQVSVIPSLHIRKWIYKCLGAHIEHDVVIHFKTELRAPERLILRGRLS